jgi:uncharacterized membrane protein HdeD (DUF308 family)
MDTREQTYINTQWWVLTIQGIAAILFGIAAVFWPGLSLVTFIYLFGLYMLVAGVLSMLHGLFAIGRRSTWILTLLLGLLELGLGVYLLRHPGVSFSVLIILVGSAFVVYGVLEAVVALADKDRTATSRMLAIIAGVIGVLAGIVMFFQPAAAGVAFVWVAGLFALINGPLWIALSLDVKNIQENSPAVRAARR